MQFKQLSRNIVLFSMLLLCYIACVYFQFILIPESIKSFFSHMQALICLIITFYYTFNGFKVICFINLVQIIIFLNIFYYTHNISLIISIVTNFIILITSFITSYLRHHQILKSKEQETLIYIDDLTQTFNRRFFEQQLHKEIAASDLNHTNVGLIFIDIDNLKLVNDNFGHDYGDHILIGIIKLLNDITEPHNYICRYGGDKFAIIIPNIDTTSLESFSTHFKNSLSQNYSKYIKCHLVESMSLSMGISVYPHMANDFSDLIRQANIALYHSKNSASNNLYIYQDFFSHLDEDIPPENKHSIQLFKALLTCLSTKEPYSLGHCKRVACYASKLARHLGLSMNEINTLYYAGLLHDIGKIELPMEILNKTGELTEEELNIFKMHPVYSANILEPLSNMYELVDYVRHHHERFDGQGYPDHLSGRDISFGARILAIVDTYDTLISEEPYGKKLSPEVALNEIGRYSGTKFDPYIIHAFTQMMNE